MSSTQFTKADYERAIGRAFWRKVLSWLSGRSNELLPFDMVREQMPIQGQHYRGLMEVDINKIIGSAGRYMDFDRAFLPTQKRTRQRWESVDKAHYDHIVLPPVELYKMGDIYFVRDGNHRVSVARERGQEFIDAYVTEIDIPVSLTTNTSVDDIMIKKEYAWFLDKTDLHRQRPDFNFESNSLGTYKTLVEHISFHHWALGQKRKKEISYQEAALSWFDTIYRPLVEVIREHGILDDFPRVSEPDLYIWITKYLWYFSLSYKEEGYISATPVAEVKKEAASQVADEDPHPLVIKLVNVLSRSDWIINIALELEQGSFFEHTQLLSARPEAELKTTIPGQYEKLIEHITVHQWYLGEQRNQEVAFAEAALSWYDHVYMPLVRLVRDQGVLAHFPERTETDLYLWVIEEQALLKQVYKSEISLEEAAKHLAEGRISDDRKENE